MLINESGIKYPVEVDNRIYKKMLEQNDFTFNVYSFDSDNDEYMFYPLFVVDQPKEKHVNLVFFTEQDDTKDKRKSHYAYIKNFD